MAGKQSVELPFCSNLIGEKSLELQGFVDIWLRFELQPFGPDWIHDV